LIQVLLLLSVTDIVQALVVSPVTTATRKLPVVVVKGNVAETALEVFVVPWVPVELPATGKIVASAEAVPRMAKAIPIPELLEEYVSGVVESEEALALSCTVNAAEVEPLVWSIRLV
jgi:hypothetical protein